MSLFLFLIGCFNSNPEPLFLEKELYAWECKDYERHSDINVSTETCDTKDDGLHFIIGEYFLYNGEHYKRSLVKENYSCQWKTKFVLIDNACTDVDGVTLTAYVD